MFYRGLNKRNCNSLLGFLLEKLERFEMEDFVAFLQIELERNFGASNDDVIESLRVCEDELRRAKMLLPKPPADASEQPQKPFGLFVPPSIERDIGRRTLDHSPDLIDRRRASRSPRDVKPPNRALSSNGAAAAAQSDVPRGGVKDNKVTPLGAPVSDAVVVETRSDRTRDEPSRRRRRGNRPPSSGAEVSNTDDVFISPVTSPQRTAKVGVENGVQAASARQLQPEAAKRLSSGGSKQRLREFEALSQHMNKLNDEARSIEVKAKRSSRGSTSKQQQQQQRVSSSNQRESPSQSSDYDNFNGVDNGGSNRELPSFRSNDGVTRLHVTGDGNSRMRRSKSDHSSGAVVANQQQLQQTIQTPASFSAGRSTGALQNGVHTSNTQFHAAVTVNHREYGEF